MKFFAVISLLALLSGCKSEIQRFPEPENLVPRDTMVMILQDLTVIEAYITNKYPQVNRYQKWMVKSGDGVLEKYHVPFKRFDQSLNYYGSRQDVMQSIYTEVQDSLAWKMNHLQ